ncbi:MAG: S-adenosylhomocysteine deaminase [Deltaproteobacteria bacterium]|nr:MAG: S-adenosylhomocysteine deaminase [Deltaproteobacteria bacterium]
MKKDVDILILGGLIVTMDQDETIHQEGAVVISDGKIIELGSKETIRGEYRGHTEIDATGCVVMPGLINVHTHSPMTIFRGLADDLPLMTWLTEHIFPAEKKITRDIVYKGTLLACAEMILGGTTTFVDMYLFADQVALAAKKAGMRAMVGEVLYDFPSPNHGPPEKGLEFTENLIGEWSKDELISVAVQPHAVYTCSPDLLKKCHKLAQKYETLFIIHLSENDDEVKQVKERYGKTPVEHVESLGLLDSKFIGVHCVRLTQRDIDLLAGSSAKVAHNPESNMKLVSGICPVPKLLQKEIVVGLGTDGCASNNDLDMWGEMDTCAKLHKVATGDPTVLPAKQVVRMATIEGAKLIGMEEKIGSLEPGKVADVIVVDFSKPHLTPLYNVYSHLVYAASASDVKVSIINGKIVMRDRQIITLNIEQVMKDVNEIARSIIRPE